MKTEPVPGDARRAALQLIDCNAKHRPQRQCVVDEFPFILPEVKVILSKNVDYWEFECAVMGLTTWQRNKAWDLLGGDPRFTTLVSLIERRQRIWHVMEDCFSQERRFVLAMLQEHYPAAASRLMKSLQPKDGPICRVRRRRRRVQS
jgi:hypothetical protein